MSDLPNGLFQQSHARPKTGEELEVLGKTAASKWLEGRAKDLNEAVIETVKSAGLSPEQVKRVCEFTNTDAFLREFKKESGVNHKVVDFDCGPADHGEVLKSLNSGAGGSVHDPAGGDYDLPPSKHASASLKENLVLRQAFGFDPGMQFAEPLVDVMDLRDKIAGAYDQMSAQLSGLEIMCEDTQEILYQQVKQAALQGASLGDITQVLAVGAPDDRFLKIAFEHMTPRLLHEGVYSNINDALASMDKVASKQIVNPNHPLVTAIADFAECLSKLAETRAARVELNEAQAEATSFLKKANGGHVVRLAKKVHETAGKAAPHAGNAAKKVVDFVAGEGAGDTAKRVTEHVVKNAPLAVAAGATLHGARVLSNNPGANRAYHKANAVLNPASDDWDNETARQQMPAGGFYPQGY
jgi:hypothetical protein